MEERRDRAGEYSPTEVATLLRVSPSTLRFYAVRFRQFLSAGAQGETEGVNRGFRHRRYTAADVEVLRRVKRLLDAGSSSRFVVTELGGVAVPRPPRRRRRPPAQEACQEPRSAESDVAPVVEPVLGGPEVSRPAVAEPSASDGQPAAPVSEALAALMERSARLEERLDSLECRLREVRDQLRDLRELQQANRRPDWLRRILGG